MTAKSEKIRDKRLVSVMFIIIVRFVLALILSMMPICFGVKTDVYVIPLVILNFIVQFFWAIISMRSYFKEIRNLMYEENKPEKS